MLYDDDGHFTQEFRDKLDRLKRSAFYQSLDEDFYSRMTARQNKGLPCTDCGSHTGHFGFCKVFKQSYSSVSKYAHDISEHYYSADQAMLNAGYKLKSDGYTWVKESKHVPLPTTEEHTWLKAQHITWEGDERA